MNIKRYNPQIQDLYNDILEKRSRYQIDVVETLDKLMRKAKEISDNALIGYCHYYYCEVYCMYIFNPAKFQRHIIEALDYLQRCDEQAQLGRCYNILGIHALMHGNITLGLDYLLTALRYCKDDENSEMNGVIQSNIANLYEQIGDYETALRYCMKARSILNRFPKDSLFIRNILLTYNIACRCYQHLSSDPSLHLPEMEDELENAYMLENASKHPFEINDRIFLSDIEIRVFHFMHDYPKRDLAIRTMLHYLQTAQNVTALVDDICQTASFVMEIGNFEDTNEFLKILRPELDNIDVANIECKIVELEILYQKSVGNRERFLFSTSLYYELNQKLKESNAKAFKSSVAIRQAIEELQEKQKRIESENLRLLHQAEYDELTGLPNRYHLNTFSDRAFDDAIKHHTSLAVEILDVDYFKEYNDTFGHQAGDVCLAQIARILEKVCAENDGIYAARYGGDEFILLYQNRSNNEVRALASHLQLQVASLDLRCGEDQKAPVVSISQGIRNSVPVTGNRLWDFMHSADYALYEIKNQSKGSIKLVSSDLEIAMPLPKAPIL